MKTVRAAIVQHPPSLLDLEDGVRRAVEFIGEAAGNGANLVAFSETWLGGYPVWMYGSAAWDDPVAKDLHRQQIDSALAVGDRACQRLADAAERHRVELVIGATERDAVLAPGTLYNSLLFFGSNGALRGIHRKLVPTHAERLVWGHGDAHGLAVHDTAVGRIGGLICWEHWMPLPRFALHALGEQIHVAAWPMLPEMDLTASRHYACEGRTFVLAAAQILSYDDLPSGFIAKSAIDAMGDFGDGTGLILAGGSAVIDPSGAVVTGPAVGEATIVYADLDLARCHEELHALDSGGHYNRPDVFAVTIDRARRVPFRDLKPF